MTKKPPTGQTSAGMARYFAITLAVLAGATVILQVVSLGPLRNSFWGFHLYAFIPATAAIVGWMLLLLAGLAAWRPSMIGGSVSWPNSLDRLPISTSLGLAFFCTLLFWLFRSGQILLGDAHPLTVGLPDGQSFHPRQPGTMWLQQALYQNATDLFRNANLTDNEIARKTVALGSAVAGFFFVLVSVGLGRAVVYGTEHRGATPWLVTLLLLAQGYALLFFGYIENYTFYTLLVAAYVLTALLHLQGRLTLQVVVVVYLTSLALHLSTIGLLPSLAFLIVRGVRAPATRRDALTAIGIGIAGVFLVDYLLGRLAPNFGLWHALRDILEIAGASQGGGAGWTYWFSATHLRDFINEHFLIGPLAAFLFVPAGIYAVRRKGWVEAPVFFLLLAALSYLAGSFIMSEPLLGYARDWDLFAPAAVCYTATGLYLLVHYVKDRRAVTRLLGFGLVFSLLQLVPWVYINHSETRSLERFKTLPLGYGRTEVVVANWYLRRERHEESLEWLRKAIRINPGNANAYNLLALISIKQKDYERAREAYSQAVALRPDKIGFRRSYAYLLVEMQRHEEALVQLRWLVEKVPEEERYWTELREVLLRVNRIDELRRVSERLLALYETRLSRESDDVDLLVDTGIILGDLGRYEEALQVFRRALTIDPSSAAALFNSGSLLVLAEQWDAARRYLERFIELYPSHEHAGWARDQLAAMP